jgi:hypothetical protein
MRYSFDGGVGVRFLSLKLLSLLGCPPGGMEDRRGGGDAAANDTIYRR